MSKYNYLVQVEDTDFLPVFVDLRQLNVLLRRASVNGKVVRVISIAPSACQFVTSFDKQTYRRILNIFK